MTRNPLFARLDTQRHATGLWSATVDCDHGLSERTRVRYSFGHLSEHGARQAGLALAAALGRSVIAASVALAMVAHVATESRASDRAMARMTGDDGTAWRCVGSADCSELARRMRCIPVIVSSDGTIAAICDPAGYRRALARHSA